jgi:hypothetical protein
MVTVYFFPLESKTDFSHDNLTYFAVYVISLVFSPNLIEALFLFSMVEWLGLAEVINGISHDCVWQVLGHILHVSQAVALIHFFCNLFNTL